ncbi:hypothetical protein Glove_9g64 [Diversispora epigaea]|uniref:Uncharacterized protein n=1 Tax=Diversispora epigaea TaxID=1348612 RepID=A0A397JRM6_9GLOM|nr:hypothetical protein Glove_9g64 [Diversispora epigaea]
MEYLNFPTPQQPNFHDPRGYFSYHQQSLDKTFTFMQTYYSNHYQKAPMNREKPTRFIQPMYYSNHHQEPPINHEKPAPFMQPATKEFTKDIEDIEQSKLIEQFNKLSFDKRKEVEQQFDDDDDEEFEEVLLEGKFDFTNNRPYVRSQETDWRWVSGNELDNTPLYKKQYEGRDFKWVFTNNINNMH